MSTCDGYAYSHYKITKPIRLIELFAGVGSQAAALRNIGADFTHYRVVEFDKFPIKSYNEIHNTSFDVIDITNLKGSDLDINDVDTYDYIMTYSFPCQDLSVAGRMQGMAKGSKTRSGLLWEVERLLNEVDHLPQILMMENVTQVVGTKNQADFKSWCDFLESKGYRNYYDRVNALDHGVAQSRNRVFMFSILGDYRYDFPEPVELTTSIRDYLEADVDEKFYITSERADTMLKRVYDGLVGIRPDFDDRVLTSYPLSSREHRRGGWDKIAGPICARDYKDPKVVKIPYATIKIPYPIIVAQRGRYLASGRTTQRFEPNFKGLCNTITTVQKDNLLVEPNGWGYLYRADKSATPSCVEVVVNDKQTSKPLVLKKIHQIGNIAETKGFANPQTGRVYDIMGSSPTLNTMQGGQREPKILEPMLQFLMDGVYPYEVKFDYRIRKLTPRECWRLMGFSDEDFDRASMVNSNSQLYKQAGNSIVVPVLEDLFSQFF